jgi:pimeloyl-ACP methyl ester carboxylesterase
VAGGKGEPLVLLPGWPETWFEYRKVMPSLAAQFRVIVAEPRGMGESGKPLSGYDKRTMARDIHALTRVLGHDSVNIAGHDIGAMVAFSFAVNHPQATRKVALLEVPHPDPAFNTIPILPQPGEPFFPWWFAFNQVRGLPEQLVSGRSRFLINSVLDELLVHKAAIDNKARAVYAAAYDHPDAIRASNGWYQAFGQDIMDFASYGKVAAPMLGLASPLGFGFLEAVLPAEGTSVKVSEIGNCGHYLVEEQPDAVSKALTTFFS